MVSNDYTIRFCNRFYQLLPPAHAGERGGRVVIELRLDGSMAIRFGDKYLKYHEIAGRGESLGGAAPQTPRSLPHGRPTPEEGEEAAAPNKGAGSPGVQPAGGGSGCTPAEPYPPGRTMNIHPKNKFWQSALYKTHTRVRRIQRFIISFTQRREDF